MKSYVKWDYLLTIENLTIGRRIASAFGGIAIRPSVSRNRMAWDVWSTFFLTPSSTFLRDQAPPVPVSGMHKRG